VRSQDSPDAESIRQTADRILENELYQEAEPGLVRRFWNWLTDRSLDGPTIDGGGGSGSSGGGFVLGYIVLIIIAVLVVWMLVKVMPRKLPRRIDKDVLVETTVAPRTSRDEWLKRAEQAENDGLFRQSVQARYRAIVAGLLDRDELPTDNGATSGEYNTAFDEPAPRGPSFAEASVRFEDVWFGGHDATVTDSGKMKSLDETVVTGSQRGSK